MKKSALRQRAKKEKDCPEGHSMQTKMDSKGKPMRDPDGKIIKSCQLDKKEMEKVPGGDEGGKRTNPESGKKGMKATAASEAGYAMGKAFQK